MLSILAGCFIFITGTGSVGFLLQMSGKQDIELINTLATAALNIGLNLWLIPLYGAAGAALATGISLIFINIIKLLEVRFLLNMQPYDKKYIKPFLSGICILFLGLLGLSLFREMFENIWLISIVGLSIIYFSLLYVLKFHEEDKMIITAIKERMRGLI